MLTCIHGLCTCTSHIMCMFEHDYYFRCVYVSFQFSPLKNMQLQKTTTEQFAKAVEEVEKKFL